MTGFDIMKIAVSEYNKEYPDYAPCLAAHALVQIVNKQQLKEGWAMARNKVQFQKGLSEPGFERLYGTEEQCRAAVVASRWPDGFVCPECGGKRHSVVTTRGLYQCSACRVAAVLRRTMTYDRGSAMACHQALERRLKIDIWFCDPHAPWQRGSNENTNGLRRYD